VKVTGREPRSNDQEGSRLPVLYARAGSRARILRYNGVVLCARRGGAHGDVAARDARTRQGRAAGWPAWVGRLARFIETTLFFLLLLLFLLIFRIPVSSSRALLLGQENVRGPNYLNPPCAISLSKKKSTKFSKKSLLNYRHSWIFLLKQQHHISYS